MRYILDSYALLAYFRDEEGAEIVYQLLHDGGHTHWLSVVNLGEVYYKLARDQGSDIAEEFVQHTLALDINLVDADLVLTMDAARIKAEFPMAYADCFAAALARRAQAKVVTGDPEFKQLEDAGVIDIEWLPSKSRRR
jgi:PIN domain nuclease of toxin-antitoxin system